MKNRALQVCVLARTKAHVIRSAREDLLVTDTRSRGLARSEVASAFDRVTGVIALAVDLTFLCTILIVGPCEAMEWLAVVLRKVLLFWGR